jgi:hypothetical protein
MTSNDTTQPDPSRDEETEAVDRVDATRPLDVRADEPPRRGVADLLPGSDADSGSGATGDRDEANRPLPPAARTATVTPAPAQQPVPTGPHVPAILLGVICVAVAGLVLAQELGDLTLDWGDIGPLGIALTGGVLVLFGLLGLVSSRRKGS